MDQNKIYLDYIDKIYQRRLHDAQAVGITIWALFIAATYLCWRTIDLISKLKNFPDLNYIGPIYLYTYFTLIFICATAVHQPKWITPTGYDYRITFPTFDHLKRTFLTRVLIPLIPGITGLYVDYIGNKFQVFTIKTDAWLFVVFPILIFAISVHEYFTFQRTGYPHFASISKPLNFNLMYLVFGTFAVFNAICLYITVQHIFSDASFSPYLSDCLELGFNFAIMNIIAYFLISKLSLRNESPAVSRLERDILLYNLAETDIKRRIEEDILGDVHLYTWLSEKLSNLKLKADRFIEFVDKSDEKYREIEAIDIKFGKERAGRLTDYMTNLESDLNDYLIDAEKLVDWLKATIQNLRFQKDKYFKDLVIDTNKEFDKTFSNVKTRYRAVADKMSSLLPN